MRLMSIVAGVAVLSPDLAWAQAGPATVDQAQAIKTAIERFVGHGDAGSSGPVSVTPAGEGYAVAIDVKQALHALAALGVTIEPATEGFSTVPQPDGTWRVTSAGQQAFAAHHGDETFRMIVNGARSDGLFDPRIPAFTQLIRSSNSTSLAVVNGQSITQTREEQQGKQVVSAKPVGEGIVDFHVDQSNAAFLQDVTIDAPTGTGAPKRPRDTSIKAGAMSGSADVQGLHIRALADIWTFLVAHSDTEALKAAQSQLRDLLHQALPLFKQWSQQATVNDLAVQSSLGVFKAQMAGGSLTLAGLSGDGRAELSTTVDGLAIPEGLVPDWASDLIPSTVALRQTLSGYRLAEAADLAISSFDLNRAELYPPDTSERMKALVGPLDKMTLEVAPSHLASKLLDITVQGTVRFAQPVPNVAMTIRATGLDNAIKAIQAKAGGDPLASQVTGVMVLAKGFGKADPDGALTWVVAKSDAGGITINGIALPGGAN